MKRIMAQANKDNPPAILSSLIELIEDADNYSLEDRIAAKLVSSGVTEEQLRKFYKQHNIFALPVANNVYNGVRDYIRTGVSSKLKELADKL